MSWAPQVALGLILAAPVGALALDWPGHAEAVRAAYESGGTAERRIDALERARLLDPSRGASVLAEGLRDSEAEVRAAAAELVGALRVLELQGVLVELLGDREALVRAASASALGALGSREWVAPVSRLLADTDVAVRVAAVEALGQLGSAEAVIALSGVLRDRSSEVVVAAIRSLGRLGQPGSVYALLEKTSDPSEAVSLAAIEALVSMRAHEAEGALIELVGRGRPPVALAAIEGLGTLGAEAGVPALVGEVISPRLPGARESAIAALSEIGSPEALGPLAPLLLTHAPSVGEYFIALGSAGWPRLRRLAARVDLETSRPFLEVWLRSGDVSAVRALAGLSVDDVDSLLRLSATEEAFCAASERIAVEALDESEAVEWVRWGAGCEASRCLGALVRARHWSHTAALTLVEELGAREPELAVYLSDRFLDLELGGWDELAVIVRALGEAGELAAPTLGRLLYVDDARVRREAAYVLAELGGVNASPEIRAAVFDARARDIASIRLLAPAVSDDAEALALAQRLARSAGAAERVEALAVLSGDCLLSDDSWESAAGSTDFWLRRAAATYALQCGAPGAITGHDPVVEQLGYAGAPPETLGAIAQDGGNDRYRRLAALVALDARARDASRAVALGLLADRDDWVRAAAWSVVGELNTLSTSERAMRALASSSAVERAALYGSILTSEGSAEGADSDGSAEGADSERGERSALATARLRERDAQARRVLSAAAPHSAPVVVFAIDEGTGLARQDEAVLAMLQGGGVALARTDREGRAVFYRDDVVAVFVEDGER